MSTLAPLIAAWDEAHRELAIALDGLPDEAVWKRAHPRLLSVGEIAGHVAYWQAVWTLGEGSDRPDLERLSVQSPLLDHAFRYYTTNVERPLQADLTAATLRSEVTRIHEAAKAAVGERGFDDPAPQPWRTWGNLIQYQGFHVAYHTGQIYSVRHLLGHETEDN